MNSTLTHRGREYVVKVKRPEAELEVDDVDSTAVQRFEETWHEMETKHRHPVTRWQGEDYAIARNFVRKWGLANARKLTRYFWWLEASELDKGVGPMRALVNASGLLARELELV